MLRRGPYLLLTLAAIELVVAAGAAWLAGFRFGEAIDEYVLTNAAMGTTFALCGAVVARSAPRNPIGWLFLGFGLAHLTSAALIPVSALIGGHPVVDAVAVMAWPFGIGMFLPLALQLFPDGRPLSSRWRPLLGVTVVAGVLFSLFFGVEGTALQGTPVGAVLEVSNSLLLVVFVATVASLVLRYRRGGEVPRRRLLWLVVAALGMLVINAQRFVLGDGPVLPLLAVNLIPVAVTVAMLRHGLFDVRLVVSRTVLYLTLSGAVAGVYAVLLAVFDRLVGGPVLATLLIALAFNPARVWLQRRVDRLFYGNRNDPALMMSTVSTHLNESPADGPAASVREALRLTRVDLHPAGTVARHGQYAVPLVFRGNPVGTLIAGPRPGQRRLSAADRAALDLLAAPLSAAAHSEALAEQLRISRERIVTAAEEERRRLHNEVHDRLGPALTGAAFKADAIGNLATADPERVRAYSAELSAQIRQTIDDVRRLVYGLRPPVLDELGLLGAISHEAVHLGEGVIGRIVVESAGPMPGLPAAVEVAAYRIATEAMTNAIRHSTANRVIVRLEHDEGELRVTVTDDGTKREPWTPGVGLRSAAERAAEIGGTCTAGPTPAGGRVAVVLPLAAP